MKVSELTAALQKVQQIAGDVDVTLKGVEGDVETELLSIGVHIDPSSGEAGGVVLEHGEKQQQLPLGPQEPAAPPAV